jgi:hypothetical protein
VWGGGDDANTKPAPPTTAATDTDPHNWEGRGLARWRVSAVGLGASAWGFPAAVFAVTVADAPFPVPARQTVHAVLPHTAYRRSSPAAFDFPGPHRPGRDDDPIETDQAQVIRRQQHLGHAPTPCSATIAPFRQPQREPT